ncbi:hypothetical protein C6502_19850 [Candidatus Poribacteria bacterium]|nr:MAG: hypothetical protein C6502_19850 [Candidatus Poribacteria bacterium]
MSKFDLSNLNMLYLQQLPSHFITKAIKASFIDEPIWQMRDAVEVIKAIEQTQFAITNVYVYAFKDGVPIVPSEAVYDFEIEELPLNYPWHQILKKSSDMTMDFVKRFQFLASGSLHGQEAAFSFWAFNEEVYRRFQKYSDKVEAQEKQ